MSQIIVQVISKIHTSVYYQPRVSLAQGRICSAEALIRWQHSNQWARYNPNLIPAG